MAILHESGPALGVVEHLEKHEIRQHRRRHHVGKAARQRR